MEDIKLSKLNIANLENELTNWFTHDSSWDTVWREQAKEWYDYYHGRHWKPEEVEALEARGQAVTTYNFIKPTSM